ncbi:MAG: hypothetical protein ACT4P3_08280 [Betaproteobacteria bacterium]
MNLALVRLGINLWPPFLGAGIRVRRIAADWSEVQVELLGDGYLVWGEKVLPEFDVEVRDAAGALVARVRKTLYVRLKARYRP